jgi:hypothetical protein
MAPLKLSHQELATNASRFAGNPVILDGVLVVEGDESYLIVDPENSKIRVTVRDAGFLNRMLDNVPCYVGGQYLYQDNATLHGTLGIVGENQLELRDIKSVRVSRETETFEF